MHVDATFKRVYAKINIHIDNDNINPVDTTYVLY